MLVVEDDFLIGLELAALLSDAGADVVGPAQTLDLAVALAEDEELAAAVLDLRLGAESVAPVARCLAARGIPFLFYTGQTRTDPLRAEWPNSTILAKPALPATLLAHVARLVEGALDRRRAASAGGP